jgi:UPF0271 protein
MPATRSRCGESARRRPSEASRSYRDLAGFGRRRIEYDFDELRDDVIYQLAALDGIARVAGTRVSYVKPHGALYNSVVWDTHQANAVVAAVAEFSIALPLLCLPDSALLRGASDAGLRGVGEGFADRGYLPSGQLVPRSQAGAVVTSRADVVTRALRMASAGEVVATDGTVLPMAVDSICLHGDTPGAVALARAVRAAVGEAGFAVGPFA